MKRERSFQRKLLPIILLLAAVPLFLFSIVALVSLRSILVDRYEEQVESDLGQSEKLMNITLDRYEAVLDAAASDEEFLDTAKKAAQGQELAGEDQEALYRQLERLARQGSGAAGAALLLENGGAFFFDQPDQTPKGSEWMEAAAGDWREQADKAGDFFYSSLSGEAFSEEDDKHVFGVFRRLPASPEGRQTGALALWLDAEVLRDTLAGERGIKSFVSDGEVIIAATESEDMGESPARASRGDYYIQSVIQQDTGWKITELYSLERYHYTLFSQLAFEVLIGVAVMAVLGAAAYLMSVPMVRAVRGIAAAMAAAREGDYSVRVEENPKSPYELNTIATGFNSLAEQTERLIRQLKQTAEEQKNAELQALEAQIDPHFLYNTLDTINWKAIEKDEMEISEMVGALADILRYSVINAGEESPIRSELYWLRQYVLLQQEKLGKEIQVTEEVPEGILNMKIHKLLLQPFVENSIRHGFRGKEGECCLKIRMTLEGGMLHIQLEDNGRGMAGTDLDRLEDEDRTRTWTGHVGVENVRKRLRLYYSDKAYLRFESQEGVFTRVHIYIPVPEGEVDVHEDRDRGGRGGHTQGDGGADTQTQSGL